MGKGQLKLWGYSPQLLGSQYDKNLNSELSNIHSLKQKEMHECMVDTQRVFAMFINSKSWR